MFLLIGIMDDVFSVFKYLSSFQFPKFIIFKFHSQSICEWKN